MLVQRRSKPAQPTQLAAQRLLASDEKTAARPSPYCQRTSSGSFSSTCEDFVGSGAGFEADVAGERGGGGDVHLVEQVGRVVDDGFDGLLDGRGAGVFLDVFQEDLFEAVGLIQEVRLAFGELGDVFEVGAVDVLPETDGGDGDAVGGGFAGEREAVAFLRDAIGEQHDVLVGGVYADDPSDRPH